MGQAMESTATKRKLAAILMADVVAYGRHMGREEDENVERLKAFRQVFADYVAMSSGPIVSAPGDSIVVELQSPVDAAACAVEVRVTGQR